MPTFYAVVGASRGIGLEYVRQLAARNDTVVFAVVRNKQRSTHLLTAVSGLSNVHVIEGDIVDHKSMERAAREIASISGGKLDFLIHNAAKLDSPQVYRGFYDYSSMDELDADLIDSFKINSLGVIHSISAFVLLLRAGDAKRIVVISTGGADPKAVFHAGIGDMVAYGITKAAAVMIATKWATKLKDDGFVVVSLAPGLVDTTATMGETGDAEAHALLMKATDQLHANGHKIPLQTPAESVKMQIDLIDGLKTSDNGALLSHTGRRFFD
ncbi:NAD-P-binding protein [Cubamyces sp. BRFM 1775]|nr:NAD-P-binding protein [Cubamyces sp. BRFM 1775]